MAERDIFRPKVTEAQRSIVLRALRAYMIELIKDLDRNKPIGPNRKKEADYLESCFMIYLRFRDMKIGRPYPYWWNQTYDWRLREIYEELREDKRQEQRAEMETDKSPEP